MAKDPAFLFYSKDFYEGTRMMLPEERACYIDLMIYQHQNGVIPSDIKRLVMYCSGCSEETIKSVLNQKFNHSVNGWLNERLTTEVNKRKGSKPKKTASACLAGLISSSKLSRKQKEKIKKMFVIDDFIKENGVLIKDESIIKSRVRDWFKNLVNQMVNNLVNVNVNVNVNKNINEDKIELKKIVNLYHQFCSSLPKVQVLSEARNKSIIARIDEHGLDKVTEVFRLTGESNFLNGENKDSWNATFDWIMNPTNFVKILEGNYKNKDSANNNSSFSTNR